MNIKHNGSKHLMCTFHMLQFFMCEGIDAVWLIGHTKCSFFGDSGPVKICFDTNQKIQTEFLWDYYEILIFSPF